ncbi:MAG: response regulator [Saprospirales bacterium]|nr:response regulator [Saprospirales bacterium]
MIAGNISWAQALRVQAITVADGLSQGFVSALFEDRHGFIWIGTFNGLNRYDGYRVKRFTPDNTAPWRLKANFIYCITEDTQGLLWIGTDKGPVVMDPYTERFVHLAEIVPTFPNSEVVQIIPGKDGRVWICHRQSGQTGVIVTQLAGDLMQMIREDKIKAEYFQTQAVRLAGDVAAPLSWLSLLNDSILTASDAKSRLCRIDTGTLLARRVDTRSLPFQAHGNYGLFYTQGRKQGFVFLPHDVSRGWIDNVNRWSEFVQLPSGMHILYRAGDSVLYYLDTLSSRWEFPGYEHLPFYRQYQPFVRLGKPMSNTTLVDRSGNIWVGTSGYGVRKISREKLDFRQYLPGRSVYNFTILPDGRLWTGIYQPRQVLNLRTGHLEAAPWAGSLPIRAWTYSLLITQNGDWWMVAALGHTLILLKKDSAGHRWEQLPVALNRLKDVPVQLLQDRNGNVWLAGNGGDILRVRAGSRQIQTWNFSRCFPKQAQEKLRSNCMVETPDGKIWVGTRNGLLRVDNTGGEPVFTAFHHDTGKGPVLGNDWILSLCPDPAERHIIWIGIRDGGLNRFDSRTGASKVYKEQDGLANNVVYGILPDTFGYLWLSTNRGLSRFNPRNETFTNVQNAVPELNTEFNTGAYRVLPTGELAFGSIEGLFLIRPPQEQPAGQPAIVAVTNIDINGYPLNFPCDDGCLRFKPDQSFALQLPYDKNNVAIEFAALQITDPAIIQYRYRLKGLSKHWVNIGNQRNANLIGLPPGKYILELQAKYPDSDWDLARISSLYLTIRPPWYRSWPAWCVYTSLAFLLFHLYVRFVRKRLALEHAIALGRQEMEQLKRLDDFKNRFFAYISHEFKTPLTIILGLAERLSPGEKSAQTAAYPTEIIRQGQNMLELVDQMVDIARLDEQQLRLQWRQGNISRYVRYIVESHQPLADFRKIRLGFFTDAPGLMMDFDPLRLKYALSNLLANAIRYTSAGGAIDVRLEAAGGHSIRMLVADTGQGIATEDLPYIFERYFRGQTDQQHAHHFGLGLAFVKDLVQLFNGAIAVSSTHGQGTTFTITLPVTRQAPLQEPLPPAADVFPTATLSAGSLLQPKLPIVLVVEDNPVIADYLQLCLQAHFRLLFAPDGPTGWEQTLAHIPDLVLTDVMLPGINGLDLTLQIKSHELTSHIPVVMLSARSELDDRLSGQRHGADVYLAKPFQEEELILALKNLYKMQRRWQERYASLKTPERMAFSQDVLPAQDDEAVRHTDTFMLKLYAVFEKNYADDTYSLPQLCRDLEISKSQLQRKLAVLSDQSAIGLLRRFRLQKAHDLLVQNPNMNVKEVCFQVGFKDPAHFSRIFSKIFGLAPSEIKSLKVP